MKRYNLKRHKLENSIDRKTSPSLRKYFNSSERHTAKREIIEAQELLLVDNEIKVRDIKSLHRALDRKLNTVNYELAKTFHRFGVPLTPGGEKTYFRNSYQPDAFCEEWDYTGMSEDELLELLALTTKQDYVIDLNYVIKHSHYPWWDEDYD